MTREKEINQASMIIANGQVSSEHFIQGAKWADQHPREGLWDSEKVVKWLETNIEKFGCFNCFIGDHKVEPDIIKSLREAMEE